MKELLQTNRADDRRKPVHGLSWMKQIVYGELERTTSEFATLTCRTREISHVRKAEEAKEKDKNVPFARENRRTIVCTARDDVCVT